MADALYCGRRCRTFNGVDVCNSEAEYIKIDTSITSARLKRIFQRLQTERGLPRVLRVDNGPEFLAGCPLDGKAYASMLPITL